MAKTMRKAACQMFLRHPSDVPIMVNVLSSSAARNAFLLHAKSNGLIFRNSFALSSGMLIRVTIPVVQPYFELLGYISWCRKRGHAYEVGLALMSEADVMRVRMVEQICYIEHYRRFEFESTGRSISGDEAAQEWIQKYAASFPNLPASASSH